MGIHLQAAMLSPPTCAASSRRGRRLTSASASARSTRIAASLSGPIDATLCNVTVFFDAMRSTSPEPVEPAGGGPGVVDGVPGITMTQIILDETQIVAPVGEIIAARMAQHVRPDRRKAGTG